MLYFLLTIIAIGVLLMSEPGKALLRFFLGGGLLLAILGVVLAILFFGFFFIHDNFQEILNVIGILLVFGIGIFIFDKIQKWTSKHIKERHKKWIPWLLVFSPVLILIIAIPIMWVSSTNSTSQVINQDIPAIGANEEYASTSKSFKTFSNELFSFQYPSHLKVFQDPNSPGQIFLLTTEQPEKDARAIVVSYANNINNLTPEQWMLGPYSGYDKKTQLFRTKIDGQDAVYVKGGMWTVVDTPDKKVQISIADFPFEQSELWTEMGIVIQSFKFK